MMTSFTFSAGYEFIIAGNFYIFNLLFDNRFFYLCTFKKAILQISFCWYEYVKQTSVVYHIPADHSAKCWVLPHCQLTPSKVAPCLLLLLLPWHLQWCLWNHKLNCSEVLSRLRSNQGLLSGCLGSRKEQQAAVWHGCQNQHKNGSRELWRAAAGGCSNSTRVGLKHAGTMLCEWNSGSAAS